MVVAVQVSVVPPVSDTLRVAVPFRRWARDLMFWSP